MCKRERKRWYYYDDAFDSQFSCHFRNYFLKASYGGKCEHWFYTFKWNKCNALFDNHLVGSKTNVQMTAWVLTQHAWKSEIMQKYSYLMDNQIGKIGDGNQLCAQPMNQHEYVCLFLGICLWIYCDWNETDIFRKDDRTFRHSIDGIDQIECHEWHKTHFLIEFCIIRFVQQNIRLQNHMQHLCAYF